MSITKQLFGKICNCQIYKYKLENNNNMSVEITNFGATIVSINVPDKNGEVADV